MWSNPHWTELHNIAIDVSQSLAHSSHYVGIAGSLRRETFAKDVDLVCVPKNWDGVKAVLSELGPTIRTGDSLHSLTYRDVQIDVYRATIQNWGAMMLFLTGPSQYNIALRKIAKEKGLLLNRYGLWNGSDCLASRSEVQIYEALGRHYTPPELRGI